jgi:hypothetical protein
MALIKRKQIDLSIKSAAGNVPDNIFGIDNLAGISAGVYSITTGDQYEIVVDKVVGAIDTLGAAVDGLYYTYLANGTGSKNLTKQATIDLKSTANQVSVSKNDLTNGVEYTFSLPTTLIAPGSVAVTSTLTVTGASTLNGAVDINNTANISGNVVLDGTGAQTITHTGASGNLTISSTNGNVLIEGTTFNGNTITVPGAATLQSTLSVTGNITLAGNSQTITHTGTGNLSISSANNVIIEGTTFSGNNVNIAGDLTVVGNITQTSVNDLIVADRFIKIADGNNGGATLTGIYQQLNVNSFAGQIYSTTENMFRFFTSTTEPTTSTVPSTLTPATVDFGAFGPNSTEALQDAVNAFILTSGAITKTYNDPANTLTFGINYGTVAVNLTLSARAIFDGTIQELAYVSNTPLNFVESDTAYVKLSPDTLGLNVIVRGNVQEDLVYEASVSPGKFTIDGNGNATLTLSYQVTSGEFVDNTLRNKEQIQVFVNGIKCKWTEFAFTAGSATVSVYSGVNTPPVGNTGLGYPIDSTDVITVIYYANQVNDTVPVP